MEVTENIALEHGLNKEEYKNICNLLKRVPNITELAIFSAMWNEHCSYKSSRKHLKKLHTKGNKVIQGPGENAGVIDNLEPALNKIDYLIATTSRFRNKNIKHIQLKDLKKIDYKRKIGFLFGSEASGLSNNEISFANYTMQIPTNANFKSLNISHSLIIVAQIVYNLINLDLRNYSKSQKINPATKKQVQSMLNFIYIFN